MTAAAKRAQRTLDQAVNDAVAASKAAPRNPKGSRRRVTDIERAKDKLWHIQAVCEFELSGIRYLDLTPEVKEAVVVLLREVQADIDRKIGEVQP
jgi:hypothetical protein